LNIYIENLNIIFNKLHKTLKTLGLQKTDKFDIACNDMDINIKEAERMLKQMDLEITVNIKDKQDNLKIFNNYKKRLNDYRSDYFKEKEVYIYTIKMQDMIVTTETDRQNTSESQPFQGKSLLDIQESTNEKLQHAKKTVTEIENTSKAIMNDLEKQTCDLKYIGENVGDLQKSISSSNALINRMLNRENRNKTFVGVFSVTLVTLFVVIGYMRF
jgi:hypothetical protein